MLHLILGIVAGIAVLGGLAEADLAINGSLTKKRVYDKLTEANGIDSEFIVKEINRTQNRVTVSDLETGKHYTISGDSVSPEIHQGDLLTRTVHEMAKQNQVKLSEMKSTQSSPTSDYTDLTRKQLIDELWLNDWT